MKAGVGTGGQRGGALLIAVVCVVGLTAVAGAILATGVASKQEHVGALERTRALYAAEAGVSQVLLALNADLPPGLGTADAPTDFAGGAYWGDVVDNGDDTWTITSVGEHGNVRRVVEAVIVSSGGGVFQNAVFAGNSSRDPAYALKFGGRKKQADAVIGDIYSGGNATFTGNATINGVPRAHGTVTTQPGSVIAPPGKTPATPQEGITQPIPDIAGMNYAVNNNVNVAEAFKTAKYASAPAGGSAWQLPEADPAHIFRLNPSDRKANWNTTAKNDYFLEDPYQTLHTDPKLDGSDPFVVKLTNGKDKKLKGAVDGNQKVYYIDGNLWVHNNEAYSFQLQHSGGKGVQVTFVVKGNIYISDNLYYKDVKKDGLALIAIKDGKVKDSGNIYFGDPTFGTLNHMDSFMYAENNFYDNNLNAAGSATLELRGNMTAGNQVAINRDFGTQHSKMSVFFDDRIANGDIELPGLPNQAGVQETFAVALWREVGLP